MWYFLLVVLQQPHKVLLEDHLLAKSMHERSEMHQVMYEISPENTLESLEIKSKLF